MDDPVYALVEIRERLRWYHYLLGAVFAIAVITGVLVFIVMKDDSVCLALALNNPRTCVSFRARVNGVFDGGQTPTAVAASPKKQNPATVKPTPTMQPFAGAGGPTLPAQNAASPGPPVQGTPAPTGQAGTVQPAATPTPEAPPTLPVAPTFAPTPRIFTKADVADFYPFSLGVDELVGSMQGGKATWQSTWGADIWSTVTQLQIRSVGSGPAYSSHYDACGPDCTQPAVYVSMVSGWNADRIHVTVPTGEKFYCPIDGMHLLKYRVAGPSNSRDINTGDEFWTINYSDTSAVAVSPCYPDH